MPRKKKPADRSRPKCLEQEVITAIKKFAGKLYMAANHLKVTTQTLRNYARQWPKVKEAILEQRGFGLDVAERKLDQAIKNGEAWAIQFRLSRQGRTRGYVTRIEQRIGGDKTAPPIKTTSVDPTILDKIPLEIRKSMLEAMRAAKQTTEKPVSDNNGKNEKMGEGNENQAGQE